MTAKSWALAMLIATMSMTFAAYAEIKAGDKLQTLSNQHPDMAKRLLYTTNYQQPGLIPVCSAVTVKKIGGKAKLNKLGKVDKDGVTAGRPSIGMTKDGILFAMGRPPVHATPNLDANYWLYWQNRFGKIGIQFDDKGKVSEIR